MAAATGTPRPLIVGVLQSSNSGAVLSPDALLLRLKEAGCDEALTGFSDDISCVAAIGADSETVRAILISEDPAFAFHDGDDALQTLFALLSRGDVAGWLDQAETASQQAGLFGERLAQLVEALRSANTRLTGGPENPIASHATAVASLVENIHGDIGNCRVLLLGDGAFGEQVLRHLLANGVREAVILTRHLAGSKTLADAMGVHFAEFETLADALVDADIVLSAIGDGRLSVTEAQMADALQARRHRPVLLVDGGIPGDIAPAINRLDDAFLFTLDDIEMLAMESLAGGDSVTFDTDTIIAEEIIRYKSGLAEDHVADIERRLQAGLEIMRNEAVAAHPNDVDRATTRLADLIARHVRTLLNAEEAEAGVARPAILKLIDSFGSNNRPKKEDEEKQ